VRAAAAAVRVFLARVMAVSWGWIVGVRFGLRLGWPVFLRSAMIET